MTTDHTDAHGWRHTAAWIVLGVATVFCATLIVLMLASVLQMRLAPPLDTPELETLREMVRQNPDRVALQEQVQALDLLARRAHFAGMKALRVGGSLLLAGLAVLLLAAHAVRESRTGAGIPSAGTEADVGTEMTRTSRRAILIAAGLVMLVALLIPLVRNGPPGGRALPDVGMSDVRGRARPPGGPDPSEVTTCAWPGFRGPGGLGVAQGVNPPLAWDGSTGSNVVWRSVVPRPGFSSPIVCGDQVFLSGGDASLREVYCYNADDGALQWRHPVTGVPGSGDEEPEVTEDTGYAASTMATDGRRVFAIFATGDIVALDRSSRRLWARHLGLPDNPYGHASSLIVYEDLVFVQLDDATIGKLLALNVADGKTVWSVDRDVEPCWASPVLVHSAREPELVVNGNPFVAGYDPHTGTERWREVCMGGEVAVSVASTAGILLVANEYARLVALRPGSEPTRLWESEDDLPDVSSPVAGSNGLFMATSYGTVTCRDAASGTLHWTHAFEEGFYASPVLAGGRVYLMDISGVMHVLAASTTFQLLSSNPLGEGSTGTAAFAGNRIYIRGAKHLFCIGGIRE